MTDETSRPPNDRRADDGNRSRAGDGSDDGAAPSSGASDGSSKPGQDALPGAADGSGADPPVPTHPKTAAFGSTTSEGAGEGTEYEHGGRAAVAAGAGGGTLQVSREDEVPADVRNYDRFQKVDKASYERVNDFLRERTYITARDSVPTSGPPPAWR